MKYKFLKDHVDFKAGDTVEDHPNAEYLKRLGLIREEKKEEPKEVKPESKVVVKPQQTAKTPIKAKTKK